MRATHDAHVIPSEVEANLLQRRSPSRSRRLVARFLDRGRQVVEREPGP